MIYLMFFIFIVLLICALLYSIKKRKAKLKSYKELYMFFVVDKAGNEWVYYDVEPIRIEEDEEIGFWLPGKHDAKCVKLEPGTIRKCTGLCLKWTDKPYKIMQLV